MRASRSLALVTAVATALGASLAGCGGGDSEDKDEPAAAKTSGAGRSSGGAASPTAGRATGTWIPQYVASMGVREKVGQLFVPAFPDAASAKAMIKRYHVGGLIFFPGNLRSPRTTAELANSLQETSKVPLLLAVDEEQGKVSRASFLTRFPGNMALGATGRPADAQAAARVTGSELRAVGINQNFAPVADVNVNPANPVIGVRSFGADPALVSRMLGAAVAGYQSAGVAATAKHFPGHGDTATDSHTGLPVIRHTRAQWERLDAPPFRAAVSAGADAIMSAHIVVPGLDRSGDPATLSRTVLTGLLRGSLGYRGVIVTDSLQMQGAKVRYSPGATAVRAVNAGADQLLMPPSLPTAYNAVLAAVRSGQIPRKRLDEAVTRILRMKEQRGLFQRADTDAARADAAIRTAANRAVAQQVAEHSVTLVRNDRGLLPLKNKTVHVTGPRSAALAAALRRQGVQVAASPQAADVAVLTTVDAGAATAVRVRALRPKPVVVAALGRPYDLDSAQQASAALAAYSSATVSVQALAKVLTGAINPTGRLPVKAGGKPIGHGLSYRPA
ncbi:glycoside hydrolase family 3 protein [Actinomadura keratinilytica]|uniref:beta-N-acetylhexosaminidase n=1 Tax=Actinomadura keratinilytica TaxID=547461 RepID=A0ABP7ZF77_9ACTN